MSHKHLMSAGTPNRRPLLMAVQAAEQRGLMAGDPNLGSLTRADLVAGLWLVAICLAMVIAIGAARG